MPITIRHFFPQWKEWLDALPDPRDKGMSTYSTAHLINLGVSLFLFHCPSRRQLNQDRKTAEFLANVNELSGCANSTVAHPDTLNYLLELMPDDGLQTVVRNTAKTLIRGKVLDAFRFDGDFLVAIDATELFRCKRRHCTHCLTVTHKNGQVDYFHRVLEAKLICPNGLVISLRSVFLENINGRYEKQDCETKAFYRLVKLLRADFRHLPITLLLDGLYASEPVFDVCLQNNWGFFVSFKEGALPTLWADANKLLKRHGAKQSLQTEDQQLSWVCNLPYRTHRLHAIFAEDRTDSTADKFVFLTDHRPASDNIERLMNQGGRARWKIENEGFNAQKTGGYHLEHVYGEKGYAWKNYYYLVQLAHLLVQLITNTDLYGKLQNRICETVPAATCTVLHACGSIRNFVKRFAESFRQRCFSTFASTVDYARSIQIRFVPFNSS